MPKRAISPTPPSAPSPHDELASLGYAYIPGPTGDPSDWVLRQLSSPSEGYVFRDQAHYDAVAAAAVRWVRGALCGLCGLLPLDCLPPSVPYASPGLKDHAGPLLLLVCGAPPGGDAAVWGRSLCINASCLHGAMFDYARRASRRGWAVLVADPHAAASPHAHLVELWRALVAPSACTRVVVVGHSYGAALAVHLLKAEAEARRKVAALALTDGMACGAEGWSGELSALLCEAVDDEADGPAAAWRRRCAAAAPLAFAPAAAEVRARVVQVATNFVASPLPAGTLIREAVAEGADAGLREVSAGSESHPSTTHAATEEVFAFLAKRLEESD
ncbi:hypothetical protein AB1Y20_018818 [Prymnesium parvum]|uniref:AB hydrolase-1 domain-containing protein n=1 Tax=Prymnesium parvum TaxID=97485 RepID=A0AB34JTK3_PRYPA